LRRSLLENSFKIRNIAGMFACSKLTIQRRMRDFGIDNSNISDVHEAVSEITTGLPACGI